MGVIKGGKLMKEKQKRMNAKYAIKGGTKRFMKQGQRKNTKEGIKQLTAVKQKD